MRPTSEESLELHASNTSISGVSENQTTNIDDALAVRPELELAVGLARVVEPHALAHVRTPARGERERAAADGRAVYAVARRVRWLVAHRVVLRVVRRQVCVQLAGAVRAPHQPRGETAVVAPPAGARDGLVVAVSAVCEIYVNIACRMSDVEKVAHRDRGAFLP